MIERMEHCGRALTEEDVRSLEHEIGFSLPEDYRRFLLRYNGGIPRPGAFRIRGMPGNPYGVIQVFFGIDRDIDSSNLKWNYEVFSQDGPADLLPVACTPSGDVICLTSSGQGAGSVVLWDYYNAPRDPLSREGMYQLADSFNQFVQGIFATAESPT
jgi:SMI1-KNR4 cell-wall